MKILKKILVILGYAIAGFIVFSVLYSLAMKHDREMRPGMYKYPWHK